MRIKAINMIEQIMHFTAEAFAAMQAGDDGLEFYCALTPAKWNADIECVCLCRCEADDMESLNGAMLGNYTDGLEPGAQQIIDRCYDRTPVEIPDTDPPEFYIPPDMIGAFA